MPPEIRYARTSDGVSIAYFAIGSGPVLVEVPAAPHDHVELIWRIDEVRQNSETVSKVMTLVKYDARGFGLSDRDATDFSLDAMVRDLEAVVDAQKLTTFGLLTWVETSPIALAYAARHPDRVTFAVLRDGLARGRGGMPEYDEWGELARANWELAKRSMADTAGSLSSITSLRQMHQLIEQSTTQDAYVQYREAMGKWDATDLLDQVVAPVLVTNDGLSGIDAQLSRKLAASLPRGSFVGSDAVRGEESPIERAVQEFVVRSLGDELNVQADLRAPSMRTILFTDLVGHTAMMQRLGDAKGRDVLREHERITRAMLRRHGGAEVKTMGDGFMASFGSVTAAVECAIALQRAFHAQNLEPEIESLDVRVGLNAGEPIAEDGDLFGATVILASRIAAKAGAGEIFVPDTVRGLLSGKNFVFSERGEFVPKGFEDAVRLYEVRWRD